MVILIVDDSRDELDLLSTRLRAAGYESLIVADSAEAALGILGQVEAGQRPGGVDLILMDIMLPGVDGLEACRRITKTECLQDIPIIVVTAKIEEKDLLAAFASGAMDYIRKPVGSVELVARVSSALALREERITRKAREQSCSRVQRNSNKRCEKSRCCASLFRSAPTVRGCGRTPGIGNNWRNTFRNIQRLNLAMVCANCV